MVIGKTYMGEVDSVPGLFCVKTEFMHICFAPLVAGDPYLFLQGSLGWSTLNGWKIRPSPKSVLAAYSRAGLLIGGLLVPGLAAWLVEETWGIKVSNQVGFFGLGFTILCIVLFFLSFRWTRATPSRAMELAAVAGIDPKEVAKRFVPDGAVEDFVRKYSKDQPGAGGDPPTQLGVSI